MADRSSFWQCRLCSISFNHFFTYVFSTGQCQGSQAHAKRSATLNCGEKFTTERDARVQESPGLFFRHQSNAFGLLTIEENPSVWHDIAG
jgi:hypothetical protein